jgi:hypothetical protein
MFIYVGPMGEAGRAAEVYFSEQAQAGDPQFIDKIAHTQLWAQTTPGKFEPLTVQKGTNRLRALVPASGTVSVTGFCEYGVLTRKVPFLLRYYPKAIAGQPEELNAMRPRPGAALEIQARVTATQIRFTLLRDGQPVPNTVFTTVDADLSNETVKAGDTGEAVWTPSASGRYSVYTQVNTKASGEVNGKKYEEIREFPSLAFDWPLGRSDADAEAVSLFTEAVATRAVWKSFPGFTADLSGAMDGRPFAGTLKVDPEGHVTLAGVEAQARDWVQRQLASITMHRMPEDPDAEKPVLRFADQDEDHPLGRLLVFEGGQFASSYRVKDRQISVVNRHMGRSNMTIITLQNDRNAEGFYLPRSYVVETWDASDPRLRHVETIQDRWVRVGSFDLPSAHVVTSAADAGLTVRSIELSGHKLAGAK